MIVLISSLNDSLLCSLCTDPKCFYYSQVFDGQTLISLYVCYEDQGHPPCASSVTSPYFKGHSTWSHAVLLPAGPGDEPHLLTGEAPLLQDILAAISSGASLHQSSTLSFLLRLSYFSLYLRTEMASSDS